LTSLEKEKAILDDHVSKKIMWREFHGPNYLERVVPLRLAFLITLSTAGAPFAPSLVKQRSLTPPLKLMLFKL